jgi:hypothetical protein
LRQQHGRAKIILPRDGKATMGKMVKTRRLLSTTTGLQVGTHPTQQDELSENKHRLLVLRLLLLQYKPVSATGSRRYVLLHLNTRKPSKHLVIGQANYATLHRSSEIDQIFQGMYACLYKGALNCLRDCHSLMTALPEWAEAVLQLAYQTLNSAITAALPVTNIPSL